MTFTTMPWLVRAVATVVLLLSGAAQGLAAEPEAPVQNPAPRGTIDAETGRDLGNYPPHRPADIEYIRLEVVFPDMGHALAHVRERITFTPRATELRVLTLNGAYLGMESVSSSRGPVAATVREESQEIDFTFESPVLPGEHADLDLSFTVSEPAEGLTWTLDRPGTPGARPPMVYSQGEPESNRYWFVGPDSPNERFACDLVIDVPMGFEACANGRLVSRRDVPAGTAAAAPMTRFHWSLDRPIVNYLVSLVVGKFDVVDVGDERVPMPVYAPLGQGAGVRATFGRTARMVSLFERLTGQPYPWPKYAQLLVTNFPWGGMENASATTLYDTVILDKTAILDGDRDSLISHELAHQWFGDLITCKSWAHVWLNEGFATYFEKLWEQYRDASPAEERTGRPGSAAGLKGDNDRYDDLVWLDMKGLIENDEADSPNQRPMVTNRYLHPDEVFDLDANPYPKGSMVLHMLRMNLGDEVFFRALSTYAAAFKDTLAETVDFRREVERVSGRSLGRFFDQWCLRPGIPAVRVSGVWESKASELVLTFEQTQRVDGDNPAFEIDTSVLVRCAGDRAADAEARRVRFDGRAHTERVRLPGEPVFVAVNPHFESLCAFDTRFPVSWIVNQLAGARTMAARLSAARQLTRCRAADDDVAVQALLAVLTSESAFFGLRRECAEALGTLANPSPVPDDPGDLKSAKTPASDSPTPPRAASPEAAAAIARVVGSLASIGEARVRAGVVAAAGVAMEVGTAGDRDRAAAVFAGILEKDASYAVRAAAVGALARLGAPAIVKPVLAALEMDSQDDRIRVAAVRALTRVPSPGALDIAIRLTEHDRSPRVRAAAVTSAARLAEKDAARVFARLAELVHDREIVVSTAAVKGLGRVKDARARAMLVELAASHPSASLRALAVRTMDEARERACH